MNMKHGMSKTRIYRIWHGIKRRCYCASTTGYKHYGGRGIIMCPSWKKSFDSFYKDMKKGYEDFLTIDRINTNGHYCPFNCRWVTQEEQKRNSRQNKFVTINNVTKPLFEWLKYYNMKRGTYTQRVYCYKMTPQQALVKPVRHRSVKYLSH